MMKMSSLIIAAMLLAACTPRSEDKPTAAPQAQNEPAAAINASAEGTVEAVDTTAGTVTIAHGAVEALQWPAMTMTFQAPGVDLSAIQKGNHVAFEFTSMGSDNTITKITKHQ